MTPFLFSKVTEKTAELHGDEAKHCMKVMRHRAGEHVIGVDGKGKMLECRILGTIRDIVELEIVSVVEGWGEKDLQITLGVSMLHKPDRFEWLLEKSVELGANRIVVYAGKHTVKTGVRIDRLERILQAALKQCMRSRMPLLVDGGNFFQALPLLASDVKLIAHAGTGTNTWDWAGGIQSSGSISLLIGPEGDFAEEELEAASKAGFQAVGLGQNRLRSETAAIHILGLVKHHAGY